MPLALMQLVEAVAIALAATALRQRWIPRGPGLVGPDLLKLTRGTKGGESLDP